MSSERSIGARAAECAARARRATLVDRLQRLAQVEEPELVMVDLPRRQQLLNQLALAVVGDSEIVVIADPDRVSAVEQYQAFGLVVRVAPLEHVDDQRFR